MQDETILFDPTTNKFCLLNATAAFLWSRLEEPSTLEQLCAGVQTSFGGVAPAEVERDVRGALEQFRSLSFVVSDA